MYISNVLIKHSHSVTQIKTLANSVMCGVCYGYWITVEVVTFNSAMLPILLYFAFGLISHYSMPIALVCHFTYFIHNLTPC